MAKHLSKESKRKLPEFKLPPEYQKKVDERKKTFETLTAPKLARAFAKMKRTKWKLEAKVKDQNVTEAALTQLLRDQLEGEEVEKIELRGGILVFLRDKVYSTVKDRQTFFRYIKRTKQIALLSVNAQTLNGLVRTLLEGGSNPPPGIDVFLKAEIGCRGLKGNGGENGDESH